MAGAPTRAAESNLADTTGEAGTFRHLHEDEAHAAPKERAKPKPKPKPKPERKGKAAQKGERAAAETEAGAAGADSSNLEVTDAHGDADALDSVFADTGAAAPDSGMGEAPGDSGLGHAGMEAHAQAEEETLLVVLPMVAAAGVPGRGGELEKADAALRMGLAQSGKFRVLTQEEAARLGWGGGHPPRNCFSDGCVRGAARKWPRAWVVASQISKRDSVTRFKLVMAGAPNGAIRRAMQVWGRPGTAGIIPFAREAALRFAAPESETIRDPGGGGIDGAFFTTRSWREIPWLNPNDSVDNRNRWRWAGSGVLLAGVGLAFAEGQLTQADGNSGLLAKDVLSGAGAQSFLRGFFAAPTLGARYAAMGGAGIAHVDNGLSLLMNPAGVAVAETENVVAAKRSLPDGTPSLFMGYSGPLRKHWAQGVGMQFEGDRLANETTLHGALGYDLSGLWKDFQGIKVGVQPKIYLAQVGEEGVGEDRSTGHSFGMALDLGMHARLNEKISAGLAIRDALGFLRHTNTLTNRSYSEALPTEYRVGAAYRASPSLLLLMDGQKSMWADQADHLRLGAEDILFDFLSLRCGMHEIFGREAVRKLSLGFGMDTHALGDKGSKVIVALNYAYEFGLGEDEVLGQGQQFSLEASF